MVKGIVNMITQDEFCLILYQLLPTTSVGNEYGQQMRIQILILGFKALTQSDFHLNFKL